MDIVDTKHARLGPSGAYWWGTCPGAPALCEGREKTSSIYADNGTVQHEVAALCLWDEVLDEPYPEPLNAEGFVGRNFILADRVTGEVRREVEFTMAMADNVNTYTAEVHALYDASAGDRLFVEVSVPLDHITREDDAEGTADVVILKGDGKVLLAVDLKTGAGVPVSAVENDQLAMYASGALRKLRDQGLGLEVCAITGCIIQPPLNSVSFFDWAILDLEATMARLSLCAETVREADARFIAARGGEVGPYEAWTEPFDDWAKDFLNPSEKACKFCDAKANCPALGKEVGTSVAPSLASDFPNLAPTVSKALARGIVPPAQDSAERLAQVWKARDLISGYLDAVGAEIDRRLHAGDEVPGMGLFLGRKGNRFYTDEGEAEKVLKGARLGKEAIYSKPKLVSPAEAEKLLKDNPKIWGKLAKLISQSEGKPSADLADCGKTPYTAPISKPENFPKLSGKEIEDDDPLLQ